MCNKVRIGVRHFLVLWGFLRWMMATHICRLRKVLLCQQLVLERQAGIFVVISLASRRGLTWSLIRSCLSGVSKLFCSWVSPHATSSSIFSHAASSSLFTYFLQDPPPQAGSGEFTVLIVASGPTDDGSLVHAVAVAQPVQSWTVIRSQEDFANMGDALRPAMPGLAPCPRATADGADVQALANSRNELQQWLTSVLLNPAARDAPSVQNFLTYLANIVPPQFDRVPWTTFSPDGQVANAAQVYSSSPSQPAAPAPVATGNLEDMEMDEMFVGDDDGPADHVDSEDEDEYVGASVRYQQVDEPFTEEDEMDMMNVAGEVEMIEDVGSLAQSLGASHLGKWPQHQQQQQQLQQQAAGVQLGSAISGNHTGGLGGAMERSMHGISDSFNSVRPQSAPRLDSFKMVKVIGKGSFGKTKLGLMLVQRQRKLLTFLIISLPLRRQSVFGEGNQNCRNVCP